MFSHSRPLGSSGPELVPSSENPFYSKVSVPSAAQISELGVKTTPGYIQLPPGPGPLLISPSKLSEAGPDIGTRPFEPHNTIV